MGSLRTASWLVVLSMFAGACGVPPEDEEAAPAALETVEKAVLPDLLVNEVDLTQTQAAPVAVAATETMEFIEIHNPNAAAVSLTGVSVDVISSAGATTSYALSGQLAGNARLVIGKQAVLDGLPATMAKVLLTTSLDNTRGGVRILRNGTTLDAMSWGAARAGYTEGTSLAAEASAQYSLQRFDGADTGNNSADFVVQFATPGVPNKDRCPRYTGSPFYRAPTRVVNVNPGMNWKSAVTGALPGDEIVFAAGTYNTSGYDVIQITAANVTLRGVDGSKTAVTVLGSDLTPPAYNALHPGQDLDADLGVGFKILADNVTIADMTIRNFRDHGLMNEGRNGLVAYDVRLVDIGTQRFKSNPPAAGYSVGGVIACSEIGYTTPAKVQGDYFNAIDVHSGDGWVIRDNYLYNNIGSGTGCKLDFTCTLDGAPRYISGPAIVVHRRSQDTVVERNWLHNNYRNINFGLVEGSDGGVIRNNFIVRAAGIVYRGVAGGDASIELGNGACSGTNCVTNALVAHNTVLVTDAYQWGVELSPGAGNRMVNNLVSKPDRLRNGATWAANAGNIRNAVAADLAVTIQPALKLGSRAIDTGDNAALTPGMADTDYCTQSHLSTREIGADNWR